MAARTRCLTSWPARRCCFGALSRKPPAMDYARLTWGVPTSTTARSSYSRTDGERLEFPSLTGDIRADQLARGHQTGNLWWRNRFSSDCLTHGWSLQGSCCTDTWGDFPKRALTWNEL